MADKTNVLISPAMLWSGFLAEAAIKYSKKERYDQVQIPIGTLAWAQIPPSLIKSLKLFLRKLAHQCSQL